MMKVLKRVTALFCLLVLILSMIPASYADSGYKVKYWNDYDVDDMVINYYTMYQGTLDPIYAPTFYCEGRDYYTNIYTGWDVEISFYRPYDGASPEKAEALCKYLTSHSDKEYSSASYYCYEYDGNIISTYVWFIDGWDVFNPKLDLQELWGREFWMNCDAVGLYLDYLGYGYNDDIQKTAQELGCSCINTVQSDSKNGFPGITFGFRFVEGTDEHVVYPYRPF